MVRIAAIDVWLNSSWVTQKKPTVSRQIVHRADDRADRELPFEAEPQIGQHREDRDDDAERAALHQFAGDARADRVDAAEFVVVGEGLAQLADRGLLRRFAAGLHADPQDVTSDSAPMRCASTGPRPRLSAFGAQRREIGASPLLARSSTCVPPAKSMPKFMPTKKNSITEMIESAPESG